MRVDFGPKSLVYPEPVLIIATYNDDGTANAMNAAWGGVSDTNEIHICLSKHKTTNNILKRKEFTVSFADKEHIAACDYVGLVSGNEVPNKLEKANLHTVKASKVDAPIIAELPVAIECKLISYDENTGHLYASIVNVSVDDSVLTDNKVDLNKYHPVIFDDFNHEYRLIADKVADAFKVGMTIKG
ncbi:MAG: flavin reductase family protein [Firmicutes bacterium]|nr:flavin reductase family protein [Candidatus Colivicinus equi]